MKTELDFSRVPLDKWIDLYNATYNGEYHSIVNATLIDIKKAASVLVKEEEDYNREIVEKMIALNPSEPVSLEIWHLVALRQEAVNAKQAVTQPPAETVSVDEVIK